MKAVLLVLLVLSWRFSFAKSGALSISVLDNSSINAIPFSVIKVFKNGSRLQESETDSTDLLRLANPRPGTYDLSSEESSLRKAVMKHILISEDKMTTVNFRLKKY